MSRGFDLIIQQKSNIDEIVVYHNLVKKYRYGGDMETHKTKLLKIIYNGYYNEYPGGALKYLDEWENAIFRYENIVPEQATTSDAKRTTFAAQFTVINDTALFLNNLETVLILGMKWQIH